MKLIVTFKSQKYFTWESGTYLARVYINMATCVKSNLLLHVNKTL